MARQAAISPKHFRRTLARIIIVPVALLAILVIIFLAQLTSLIRAVQLVNHTAQVIREAASIEESLLDQQVSLRGYLITGDPASLEAYRSDSAIIDRQLSLLAGLVEDNPAQAARSSAIERAYRTWIAYAETMPATRAAGTSAAALGESERRVRATRDGIDAFVGTEQELLAERSKQVERTTRITVATSIASIFVIGGLVGWATWRQVTGLAGQFESALAATRQQAEALRESEARFRDLANALPKIIWMTYPDGNLAYSNQRWFDYTGLTPEGVSGWDWAEPIHPDDRAKLTGRWREALAGGEPFEGEYRFRRADGDYRWHLVRVVPLRDSGGQVVSWVGAGTDIHDHRQAEEALRERSKRLAQATRALAERNRELDQFAYVTSHDLRAPLRGISNLAQWIEEDLGDLATGEIREQLVLLRGRAQRMEALIEGILQFSRIGRVKETVEPVDVRALLGEVTDLLAPPSEFTIDIGPGMPTVETERTRLQQVFANLIGNALKHHDRPDGRIEVRVCDGDEPGYYQFTVADDGPGIAAQYHDRIFGIFQTLKPRDQVEGSGLGLALVKKIVEHHGGRIWLESAAGCGTAFHFTWPQQVGREEA